VASSELLALGDAFELTYYDLATQFCDPVFRSVAGIEVVGSSQIERRLQRSRGNYRYRVRKRCRGCRRTAKLFDDVPSGRLLLRESSTWRSRLLQGVDECFCVTDPVANRARSVEEFLVEYQIALDLLVEEGLITNIDLAINVTEDIFEGMSISPSKSPSELAQSLKLSVEESVIPSSLPSSNPITSSPAEPSLTLLPTLPSPEPTLSLSRGATALPEAPSGRPSFAGGTGPPARSVVCT